MDGEITAGQVAASLGLDVSQFTAATLAAKGTLAELIKLLQDLGVVTERLTASTARLGNTELVEYRSMLEAERIKYDALRKSYQAQVDYAELTSRIRAEEAAGIREQTIATGVGFQQEAAYRKARDTERIASEKDYAGLVKQLKAQEIAADEEAVAARLAAEKVIMAGARERIAATIESERLEKAIVSALRKEDLAEEVLANKVKQNEMRETAAAAALSGRLVGGWTGAAAARGAFSLSPALVGGLALAGATLEMVNWTNQAEKAAEETRNFADKLGVTWDQARRLEEVAKITGTSISTLGQASGRIAESFDKSSTAGKDIRTVLEEIGISGQSSGDVLIQFIQYLSTISDQTERISELRRVFGRGSAELVPFVTNLTAANAQLNALGAGISGPVANALIEAETHTKLLDIAWSRLKDNLATSLYPTITFLVDVVAKNLGSSAAPDLSGSHAGSILSGFKQEPIDDKTLGKSEAVSAQRELIDLANERLAAHRKTLDGMKEELVATKAIITENEKVLFRVDKPASKEEAQFANADLIQAEARKAQLENDIKDLEGKTSNAIARAQGKSYEIQAAEIDSALRAARIAREVGAPLVDRRDDASSTDRIEKRLKEQKDANEQDLKETLDAIEKKKAIQKGSGKVTDETLDQQAAVANEKAALDNRKADEIAFNAKNELIRKWAEEVKKQTNEANKGFEEFQKQIVENQIRADEAITKDIEKQQEIQLSSKAQHTKNLADLERNAVEFQFKQGEIGLAQRLNALKKIADAEDSAETDDLNRKKGIYLSSAATDENYLAKAAEVDKRLQEIKDKAKLRNQKDQEEFDKGGPVTQSIAGEQAKKLGISEEGDVSGKIVQLTNLRIETRALSDATKGLGGVYEALATSIENAFGGIGKDLANLTFSHGNFTKELKKEAENIAKEIEGAVLSALINLGIGKIITAITGGGAAAAQQKQAQVTTQANTNATIDNTAAIQPNTTAEFNNTVAVNANTQAIYQLIAALHSSGGGGLTAGGAVSAAAKGGIGGFFGGFLGVLGKLAGAAVFAEGGDVPHTGMHHLEAGEHVLTPSISAGLRTMMAKGSLSGGTGTTVHVNNPRFVGHFTKAEIDDIGNGLVKAGRRTGALL